MRLRPLHILKHLFQALVVILAHGALLLVGSELVFWAGPLPGTVSPAPFVFTLTAYAVVAIPVVALLDRVPSRPSALILAGAIYGWIVEGAVEATAYMELPVSLSWTALAWHMPIALWFFWSAAPRLAAKGGLKNLGWLAFAGALWGAWAVFWPNERAWFAPHIFALYAFGVMALFILAHTLTVRFERHGPPGWAILVALMLIGAGFATKIAAIEPFGLAVPMVIAVSVLALWRLRRLPDDGRASALAARRVPLGARGAAFLLTIPLTASLVHGVCALLGFSPATNIVVYLLTVPLGALLWLLALIRVGLGRSAWSGRG